MSAAASFLRENWEALVACLSLVVALQANFMSRRSQKKSDRLLLSEKRRDLILEIDRTIVIIERIKFILDDQLLQFSLCPALDQALPGEQLRIEGNVEALFGMRNMCITMRTRYESIGADFDPALIDHDFSEMARMQAHLQKDADHESVLLSKKLELVRTAPHYGVLSK